MNEKSIFVVAQNGGCEGYSLPVLAFSDLGKAQAWISGQTESFDVVEVPTFPELPRVPWFQLNAIPRGERSDEP